MILSLEQTICTTRNGLRVNLNDFTWNRADFALLGTICLNDNSYIGWAWHADGRSIDRHDRAFDLIDFKPAAEAAA